MAALLRTIGAEGEVGTTHESVANSLTDGVRNRHHTRARERRSDGATIRIPQSGSRTRNSAELRAPARRHEAPHTATPPDGALEGADPRERCVLCAIRDRCRVPPAAVRHALDCWKAPASSVRGHQSMMRNGKFRRARAESRAKPRACSLGWGGERSAIGLSPTAAPSTTRAAAARTPARCSLLVASTSPSPWKVMPAKSRSADPGWQRREARVMGIRR